MHTATTSLPEVQLQLAYAQTVAQPVEFGRRFGALALDWVILFFLVPGTAVIVGLTTDIIGLSNTASNLIFPATVVTVVVGGFTICYRLGATPGMLATSSRVVTQAHADHLGWGRALLRALTAFLLVASWFWVFNVFFFSDVRLDGRSTVEAMSDYGALGLFLTGILGRLWILVDQHDQTLFDRILRIQVIRKPTRPDVPRKSSWQARTERNLQ
jgi:uncharacterized RDD family membrane protein YckC